MAKKSNPRAVKSNVKATKPRRTNGHPSRVVIVTGGAKGIGQGIGECFARKGDTVVVADVNTDLANRTAGELNKIGGNGCIGIFCDVTNRDSVQAMADDLDSRFGRIDVLVNNAGICPFVEIMEMSPEVWQKTIDVDLTGPFHCTQIVARKMIARSIKGRIIFITSLADTMTGPAQVDYAAAKSGCGWKWRGSPSPLPPGGSPATRLPRVTSTQISPVFGGNRPKARLPFPGPCRWAGWASPRTSGTLACSWRRRKARMSTALHFAWMAEIPCGTADY